MTELRTERLMLRQWRESDLAPYAAMNQDPEVRRWFNGLMTQAQSAAQIERFSAHITQHGFGFWAVEAPGLADLIGFVGICHVDFPAPFTPAVEIGWRLARPYWGHGFATEAARASLAHGFGPLNLPEIVSFAVPGNTPSRAVMTRIGMRHDPEGDFDHPALPDGHPFKRHVLYRITRPA